MKKVLLVLSVAGMLLGFTSCAKDCVCKTVEKKDGDKVSVEKTKLYDLSKDEKDECKDTDKTWEDGDDKYTVKCHKTMF